MARGWSELRPAIAEFGAKNMADERAQALIVDAVRRGDFAPLRFVDVVTRHPTLDVRATFRVSPLALKLGRPGDAMRVPVTHRTQQAIADLLSLRMPTPDIFDAMVIGSGGVRFEPHLTPEAEIPRMGRLDSAETHSAMLDADAGLWDNVKSWVSHPRLLRPESERFGKETAINYGWATLRGGSPATSTTAFRVYQTPGGRHPVGHTDRSQFAIGFLEPIALVEQGSIVVPMSVDALAIHPILHPLVSRAGPIPMRHPWLPVCSPLVDGGSCPSIPDVPPSSPPSSPEPTRARGRLAVATVAVGAIATALYLLR